MNGVLPSFAMISLMTRELSTLTVFLLHVVTSVLCLPRVVVNWAAVYAYREY